MKFDDKVINIPDTLPMLPVRDIVVFPYMILPLYVGRENSIRAVEEALSKNRLIFLSSQKEIAEENPKFVFLVVLFFPYFLYLFLIFVLIIFF